MERELRAAGRGRRPRIAFSGRIRPGAAASRPSPAISPPACSAAEPRVKPMAVAVTDAGGRYEYPGRGRVRDSARDQGRLRPRRRVRELQGRAAGCRCSTSTASSAATTARTSSTSSSALRVPARRHPAHRARAPLGLAAGDRAEDGGKARAARRDERGRRRSARAALRRCAGAKVHIIPHGIPDMAPRDQDELEGQVRRRRSPHAADVRAAGPEQGHRDRDPRAAGGDRRLSRSRLLRRRRDAPGRRARSTARRTARRWSARPSGSACATTSCFATSSSPPTSCAATCRRPTSSSAPTSTRRR